MVMMRTPKFGVQANGFAMYQILLCLIPLLEFNFQSVHPSVPICDIHHIYGLTHYPQANTLSSG